MGMNSNCVTGESVKNWNTHEPKWWPGRVRPESMDKDVEAENGLNQRMDTSVVRSKSLQRRAARDEPGKAG